MAESKSERAPFLAIPGFFLLQDNQLIYRIIPFM